jgi:hypothetical protein
MVTCDEQNSDACLMALFHGVGDFASKRILETEETV